jgi:hypothetical protein
MAGGRVESVGVCGASAAAQMGGLWGSQIWRPACMAIARRDKPAHGPAGRRQAGSKCSLEWISRLFANFKYLLSRADLGNFLGQVTLSWGRMPSGSGRNPGSLT